MKKLKLFIPVLVAAFFINTATIVAQDIHFSQYYASPMSLNPAETGFFEGNWRFTNNYRTQWSAIGIPYKTISAGFDIPFAISRTSKLGLGVFFVNDNSGSSELTVNKLFLTGNYITVVDDIHKIGIALQLGYVVKSFNLGSLTLPSQYNGSTGYFDPNMPNNIDSWAENINYADINFGINYSGQFGKYNPYGGISLFHINTPKESFLRTDNKLPMRFAFNAGAYFNLVENVYLRPNLFTMYHKRAGDWILGSLAYYVLPEKNLVDNAFVGIHSRYSLNNFDSFILTGGVSIYGFDVGVSYDINISKFKVATNSKGAFEISIIYKDITKTLSKIALPCDRF